MTSTRERDPAFVERYGPWVLVAGASEGTGAEFSLQVAAKGANVILVARRADRLEALAAKIRTTYGVEVLAKALDLSKPGAAAALQAAADGKDLGLAIFNAGGDSVGGRFLDSTYEQWSGLIQRNICMLTEACHRFAEDFVRRGRGGILLVGSDAGLGGTGRIAIYAATKGYAINMGESLWRELGPKGVDVLNLLIGATDTPSLRASLARHGVSPDSIRMTAPAEVARFGLAHLGAGPTVVLGVAEDAVDPLISARLRRERVVRQTLFLNNFYGPE